MACLMVATGWAWSRIKYSSDQMLTSNGFPLFCVAWWTAHVIETASVTFSVRHTCSNQAHSSFKCDWMKFGDGMQCQTHLFGWNGIIHKVGWSDIGKWFREPRNSRHLAGVIIDPWSFTQLSNIVWSWVLKDQYDGAVERCFTCYRRWIVVDIDHCGCCEKLRSQSWWTNNFILYIPVHTTASPSFADISRTLSYETQRPFSWSISKRLLFLVLANDITMFVGVGSFLVVDNAVVLQQLGYGEIRCRWPLLKLWLDVCAVFNHAYKCNKWLRDILLNTSIKENVGERRPTIVHHVSTNPTQRNFWQLSIVPCCRSIKLKARKTEKNEETATKRTIQTLDVLK